MKKVIAGLTAVFALFLPGCSQVPDEAKDEARWTQAIQEHLEGINHVVKIPSANYYLGDSIDSGYARIEVDLHSDTEDAEVNGEILDEAAKAVVYAMEGNSISRSTVFITVATPETHTYYRLDSRGIETSGGSPSIDDLAKHYGIAR